MNDLRVELESRNLSSKGLKSQLIARLTKALKSEQEKEEEEKEKKEEVNYLHIVCLSVIHVLHKNDSFMPFEKSFIISVCRKFIIQRICGGKRD